MNVNQQDWSRGYEKPPMGIGAKLAIGCLVLVVLALLAAGGCVLFFQHVTADVEGVAVEISAPSEVAANESFTMTVTVRNERPDKPLTLTSIDIASGYLDGFQVVSVEPKPKSSQTVPIINAISYQYNLKVPANASASYTFNLKAREPGVYYGDVDIYENLQCITEVVSTAVLAPGAPSTPAESTSAPVEEPQKTEAESD